MGKKPMISKCCPSCSTHVAVAIKTCSCGHNFFHARRGIRSSPEIEIDEIRRTGRKKREKPNYYDSQEFDKRKTKAKKTRQNSVQEEEKSNTKETTAARAIKRRLKKEEEDGNGDLVAKLPPEKQEIAAIILSEINRKLQMVVWKP